MTTPSRHPVSGDPEDLKAVLGAFEERTVVVERLGNEVTALVAEVRSLRSAVTHRPSRRETERKRRIMGLAVAVWSVFLILIHDWHVEECGPGVEAKAVIERFVSEPPPTREEIIEATREVTPDYCTYVFPIHVHDDSAHDWPNHRAGVGFLAYAVIFGAAAAWVLIPGRRTRREEDHEVAEVEKAQSGIPR